VPATHWGRIKPPAFFNPANLGIRASRSGYRIASPPSSKHSVGCSIPPTKRKSSPCSPRSFIFPRISPRNTTGRSLTPPRRSPPKTRNSTSADSKNVLKTSRRSGRAVGRPSAFGPTNITTRRITRRHSRNQSKPTMRRIHLRQNIFRLLAGTNLDRAGAWRTRSAAKRTHPRRSQNRSHKARPKTECTRSSASIPPTSAKAFANIKTTDNDEVGGRIQRCRRSLQWRKGTPLLSTNPAQADKDFIRAWRLYSFARWPVPASAGKKNVPTPKRSKLFLAHAKNDGPAVGSACTFRSKALKSSATLRLPKNAKGSPCPWSSPSAASTARKEDLTENFGVVPEFRHRLYRAWIRPAPGQATHQGQRKPPIACFPK